MNNTLQYGLVGLIVAAALVYVARRFWRALNGRDGGRCGSCARCSSIPLVSLKLPASDSSRVIDG